MRRHFKILALIAACFTFLSAHCFETNELLKMPSDSLVKIGRNYAEIINKPDSALICFTIVTGRYNPNLSKEEKINAIAAFNGKWFVYRFLYFDYTKAYENLKQSQALYNELGINKARLWLNYGCMYQTLSEPASEKTLDRQAMDYYIRSFDDAAEDNNITIMQVSMANLAEVAYSLGEIGTLDERINQLDACTKGTPQEIYTDYVVLLYQGLKAMTEQRYGDAATTFKSMIALNKDGKTESRYLWLAYNNVAKALSAMREHPEALEYAHKAEDIAKMYDIKDALIESYSQLASYYDSIGDQNSSNNYRHLYFQLKDTLLNYQQMASIEELKFVDELTDIEQQINDMKHRSQIKDLWLLLAVVVILIVCLFAWLLHRKNNRLHQTNQSLYEKNVALLQVEEQAREARRENAMNKYRNSNLSDDDKDSLVERILDVMENSDEIYSSSFSSDRLAELVKDNYKYVSQAINERLNNNFNTLLNEYRVKEACKRINNRAEYGHLTIEAIARSVGFQSVNSFRSAFRRLTGLSPSEYQRIAAQNAEEAQSAKS
ncbi:MAG: AraC family transcriptional regulator [Bacteroidales bacterium]|nr:AraC family transcriptional regulator [Bacteroidales bacterium]